MKRILSLFLIGVLLLTMLASCTKTPDAQGTPPKATTLDNVSDAPSVQDSTTNEEPTIPPQPEVDVPAVLQSVADIVATLGVYTQFNSTFDCEEAILKNVAEKETVLSAFEASGFVPVKITPVEGALFETIVLTNQEALVTVYWLAEEHEMRILWEVYNKDTADLLYKNYLTGISVAEMVQIGVERDNRDAILAADQGNPIIGMCYVVKTCEGNAIVIDGGFSYETNADNLYATLKTMNIAQDENGKYKIEAWIFSHGHSDHNGILHTFSEKYGAKTTVRYFFYQIPNNSQISATGAGVAGEEAFHALTQTTYPESTYILPHAGLRYHVDNITLEMLYTPDILWSPDKKITYYNDTSIVFNLKGSDTTFLCVGDAGDKVAERMISLYDPTVFRADFLQISHHGLTTEEGGSGFGWKNMKVLYEATKAPIGLLPMGAGYSASGRNGRYTVIFGYAHSGYQMEFVVDKSDSPFSTGYFNGQVFEALISDAEWGTNRLAEQFNLRGRKTLYGYNGINIIENGRGMTTYIASSDKSPMVTAFALAYGEITLLENCNLYDWLIPLESEEETERKNDAESIVTDLNIKEKFDATIDCREAVLHNATGKNTVLTAFEERGFVNLNVTAIEGAKFEIMMLTNQEELVTIYWMPVQKELRIIWEPYNAAELAPLTPTPDTGTGTLTVVQHGVREVVEDENPDVGMSYVFKLSNGNAMIVDGGYYNDPSAEYVFKTLEALDIAQNDKGQYQIEAWIFSHGHGDHSGVIYNFGQYASRVEVSYFIYQFPTNAAVSEVGANREGEARLDAKIKSMFPNAVVINPHTGLNYYFGNATISMLYTPDALWGLSSPITYYNNTSLIFNVHGGGTSFLCMGDAGEVASARSWSLFESWVYQSGILQILHHGMSTGPSGSYTWTNVKKIYEASGATIGVLPLGVRTGDDLDSGNRRYSVLYQNANAGYHVSFATNNGDSPVSDGSVPEVLFNRFIADSENGTNLVGEKWPAYQNVKTLFGYDGINKLDNGRGMITYISCSDKAEMATVFTFANGEVLVNANAYFTDWYQSQMNKTPLA